jgi:GNAT superfamily N-acetyltransferase
MKIELTDLLRNPEHFKTVDAFTMELWPPFMLHDPVANGHWMEMIEGRPSWQLVLLLDGEPVGQANAIPFVLDRGVGDLPDEGWEWVFLKGIDDLKAGRTCRALAGIQITVKRDYQGKGLSSLLVGELRKRAKMAGIEEFVVPVRPTGKRLYPLIPMEEYASWKREDGLSVDPWVRVHQRLGAKIVKPCERAMIIRGSVSDWRAWTGMEFPKSGHYVVPGALSPVRVDIERDEGLYVEPNLWVRHDLGISMD